MLLFPRAMRKSATGCPGQLKWAGEGQAQGYSADLLHRTIFYKVGHHGSHNATLRERGLE